RHQGFHIGHGCSYGQAFQYVAQPRVRLMATGFRGLDQRIDHGTGMGAGRRVGKQPALSSDHERPNSVFAGIVVDRQIAAFGIADQLGPDAGQIFQCLAELASWRNGRQRVVQPSLEFVEATKAAPKSKRKTHKPSKAGVALSHINKLYAIERRIADESYPIHHPHPFSKGRNRPICSLSMYKEQSPMTNKEQYWSQHLAAIA